MKAILLAAGVGRRLGDANDHRPKTLLEVGGRSVLRRLVGSLARAGLGEATIVVGHRRELIEAEIGPRCGDMRVRYVFNPDYTKGPVLSLWQARDVFGEDDVLIMDADVLCPDEMIARLVRSPHRNCLLLDGRVAGSGEEQMLMTRGGRVLDIARRARPGFDVVGESVGFLKLCPQDAPALLAEVERLIAAGRERCEHEDAYPAFMQTHEVGYERVDDLPWIEIDFPEDAERARREILPLIEGKSG